MPKRPVGLLILYPQFDLDLYSAVIIFWCYFRILSFSFLCTNVIGCFLYVLVARHVGEGIQINLRDASELFTALLPRIDQGNSSIDGGGYNYMAGHSNLNRVMIQAE